MKKFSRNLAALILALLIVFQAIPVEVAHAAGNRIIDSLTVDYLFSALGDAVNYGVVANEWDQSGHAETSVCIERLIKNSPDPFMNSASTYRHTVFFDVVADIDAAISLKGMEFALFEKTAGGMVMIPGSKKKVTEDIQSAQLVWTSSEELKNKHLYVCQLQADGVTPVANDAMNPQGQKVNYGPALFTGAQNGSYIDTVVTPMWQDTIKFFNTKAHNPEIRFGEHTRLYAKTGEQIWNPWDHYWQDKYAEMDLSTSKKTQVFLKGWFYIWNKLELMYLPTKFDGLFYDKGIFAEKDEQVQVKLLDYSGYAADLVRQSKQVSKTLGNMGGGIINPETGTSIVDSGASTVTGPVDKNGYVISLYDVRVGDDWAFKVHDDMGYDGIPVADQEYAIINLIVPEKKGQFTLANGATDILYYFNKNGKVASGNADVWGSEEAEDGTTSQRIIWNVVYEDENGVMQPFEGSIIPSSQHGGLILAPAAHIDVSGSPPNGAMIANTVKNSGIEIHQRTLAAPTRNTWVRMNGGNITLTKVGAYKEADRWQTEPLERVVFGVYSDENCKKLVTQMTTDGNGKATSCFLPVGDYWVKEISAPKGYKLSDEVVKVTVESGKTVKAEAAGKVGEETVAKGSFVNTIGTKQARGGMRLLKVDAITDAVLPSATFGIYSDAECTQLEATMTTNGNGIAYYEDLIVDTYYVKEINAPKGYVLEKTAPVKVTLEESKIVTVKANNARADHAFTNTKQKPVTVVGSITVKKVDSADAAKGLAGAEFTVYSDAACTVKAGVIVTDAAGTGSLTGLNEGIYYVKETKAPDGYQADLTTVHTINVVKDAAAAAGATIAKEIVLTNQKTQPKLYSLTLEKSDRLDPAKKLEGAVYTLYTAQSCTADVKHSDIATGKDGTGTVTGLTAGTYWVKETTAPAGYQVDPLAYEVKVGDAAADPTKPVFVQVSDLPISTAGLGSIGVLKVDSRDTNKGLAGAEFTVYGDAACTAKVGVIVTGATGAGTLAGLNEGTYFVKETKVPAGYQADLNAVYQVTVVKDTITMVDEAGSTDGRITNKQLAKLILEKSDRLDPAKKLEGAVYTLYTAESCMPDVKFADVTTGKDGTGTIENVPAGTYWVKETTAPAGYEVDPLPYKVVVAADADPAKPVFVQVSDFPLRGAMIISKKVVGGDDPDATFLYDIELNHPDGADVSGSYSATMNGAAAADVVFAKTAHGAKATISLKDGQTLSITGLRDSTAYAVTERPDPRYEVSVNGAAGSEASGVIAEEKPALVAYQNTLKRIDVTVEKVWKGKDAGVIQLTLFANGVVVDPQPEEKKQGSTYIYEDLVQVDKDGKEIVYSVKETAVAGYTTIYQNIAPYAEKTHCAYNGGKIINEAKVSISVKKEWRGLEDGEKAPEPELVLYCDDKPTTVKPVKGEGGWYTFPDLPASENGKDVTYTVKEKPITGFYTTYQNKGEHADSTDQAYDQGIIINSKVPQTGDSAPLGLWLTMVVLASAGLIALGIGVKKREN